VVATRQALRRHGARALRGASIAVTLEPCDHHGRTAPCTQLLLESGLSRVLVGHVDPHPTVSGRGVARLRRAGLQVTVGVLEAECREQHRGFLSVCERGRPFVALKLASSLDGRIATASGESRWITGPAARALVHRLRARSDALMVGSQTALADDPELTARRGTRVLRRPLRVLVDSRLRVPAGARLYQGGAGRTLVLCSRGASAARRRRIAATGAQLVEVPGRGGQLDLRRGLRLLAKAGLSEVLVEGGGGLAAALLREGLVDEVHWFVAPRLLGGDARPSLGALGLSRLARAHRLHGVELRRVGEDLYLRGRLAERGR
jgi:diaminohydroxyphosphoribosylaminopyrimidine deaminase/5-amino-6-(5-phosphoribosylamino)uracil reductase